MEKDWGFSQHVREELVGKNGHVFCVGAIHSNSPPQFHFISLLFITSPAQQTPILFSDPASAVNHPKDMACMFSLFFEDIPGSIKSPSSSQSAVSGSYRDLRNAPSVHQAIFILPSSSDILPWVLVLVIPEGIPTWIVKGHMTYLSTSYPLFIPKVGSNSKASMNSPDTRYRNQRALFPQLSTLSPLSYTLPLIP